MIVRCQLLAQSGHRLLHCTCLLLGGKQTCRFAPHVSAYDPKRTFGSSLTLPGLNRYGASAGLGGEHEAA
jgi:hypothetical protein